MTSKSEVHLEDKILTQVVPAALESRNVMAFVCKTDMK